jgi:CubicO group peptidase (beta-lactamase class C family)
MEMLDGDRLYGLADRLARHECPAISLALVKDGVLSETAAFGMADPMSARTADPLTLFQAASMSKPIAAILVMQLVQEGRLRLDDDVNRYLASWEVPLQKGWPPVTLRGLLSHRSGATTVRFPSLHPEAVRPTTLEILQGRSPAANGALVFSSAEGAAETYSNTGLTLVQLILEDVCGIGFADLARERVFDVLGLQRSTFSQPLPVSSRGNAAVGHEGGRAMDGVWRYAPQLAAAGLWTTAGEYAAILIAVRAAAAGRSARLLTAEAAREMLRPQGPSFGLGWMLWGAGRGRRFGHTGSNQGYRSACSLAVESGDGVVALTNAGTGKHLYTEAIHGLAALCDWPDLKAHPRPLAPWTASLLASLAGTYRFQDDVAPPIRLVAEEGRLVRRRESAPSEGEIYFLAVDGLIFSRDSIFALKIAAHSGGWVSELIVLEDAKGEIARVRRI